MQFRFASLACLICLFVLAPNVSAGEPAEQWKTKEFEICWSEPSDLFCGGPENKSVDNLFKSLLNKISIFYSSHGLMPPHLELKEGSDGVWRYRAYAYEFEGESENAIGLFSYPASCGPDTDLSKISSSRTTINLNIKSLNTMNENEIKFATKGVYEVLAHELFHAIQFSYDEKHQSIFWCHRDPNNGRQAVVEGSALAAGVLATDAEFEGYIENLAQDDLSLGMFPFGGDFEFLKANSPKDEAVKLKKDLQYKTSSFWRYLAERFGFKKAFNSLFVESLSPSGSPALKDRYDWLNGAVKEITGTEMYVIFPEYQAELASYVHTLNRVENRYVKVSKREYWLDSIYTPYHEAPGCHEVEINEDNQFHDEVVFSADNRLYKNGASCISFRWQDYQSPALIEVQASHKMKNVIGQIHLGVSELRTGQTLDNCYDEIYRAGNAGRPDLECSFSKLFNKEDKGAELFKRTWVLGTPRAEGGKGSFFARELDGRGFADLIVTNIAKDPSATVEIPSSDTGFAPLTIEFSISSAHFFDQNKKDYGTIEQIQLRETPFVPGDIPGMASSLAPGAGYSVPGGFVQPVSFGSSSQVQIDRYSYYGIKKPSKALPNGLGTSFRTVSSSDPRKHYTFAPFDPKYKFGVLGKMNAIVSNEKGENSIICQQKYGLKPTMNVTKSDKKQLRFEINTDICKMLPSGQIEKVDRIDAKFVYAFGRRAYPDTAPQDVITPGLELYIDEYLKELVRLGVPLPPTVLMADGSVPGDEDGDGTPDNVPSPNPGDNTNNKTGPPKCDCSCAAFSTLKRRIQQAQRSRQTAAQIRSIMACAQVCALKWGECDDRKN